MRETSEVVVDLCLPHYLVHGSWRSHQPYQPPATAINPIDVDSSRLGLVEIAVCRIPLVLEGTDLSSDHFALSWNILGTRCTLQLLSILVYLDRSIDLLAEPQTGQKANCSCDKKNRYG